MEYTFYCVNCQKKVGALARLPIRDNIDKTWVNRFEDELNEIMGGRVND